MTSLLTKENKIIQQWEQLGYDRWRLDGHAWVTCSLWKEGRRDPSIRAIGPTIPSAMDIALYKAMKQAEQRLDNAGELV